MRRKPRLPCRREVLAVAAVVIVLVCGAWPSPVEAGACASSFQLFWEPLPGEDPRAINCLGAFRCWKAENLGPFARDGGDGRIFSESVENFLEFGGVTCANSEEVVNTFNLTVTVCKEACEKVTTVTLFDGGPAFTAGIGCPQPPLVKDCPTSACGACVQGVPVDGGGAPVASTGKSRRPGPPAA